MLLSTPIALVCALDPVLRDCTIATLAFGNHHCVVLRHDLDAEGGVLRRVVSDSTGVIGDDTLPLEHACAGCALREDALPMLERLVAARKWDAVLYVPPLGTDPLVVATSICGEAGTGRSVIPGAHLAQVTSAVDAGTLVDDVLGDATLMERDSRAFAHDDRSVGESLTAMLEYSDIVILDGASHERASIAREFATHLINPAVRIADDVMGLSDCDVFDAPHDIARAVGRRDPARVRAYSSTTENFWSITLDSERPFHPGRLMDHVEELGTGKLRARGCFWVPTRPDSVCQWDGAGGQVSIGVVASWLSAGRREPTCSSATPDGRHTPVQESGAPLTRLIITGYGDADRERVATAFERILLTQSEWQDGLGPWLGVDDGLDPWLGERGPESQALEA